MDKYNYEQAKLALQRMRLVKEAAQEEYEKAMADLGWRPLPAL